MISAITFDLDGVYFPNGKKNFLAALAELGVSAEEATRVFLKSEQMNKLYKNGQMSDHEFWSWAAQEWRVSLSPDELISLLISGYEVDEKVAGVVRNAREKGYKTLICSNNFPARIDGLQERFGFLDDFDAVALSYDVGASKPSEKIFRALISRAGVPAHEIVFADDNTDNLAGAQALGITTFVYEGFEGFLADLQRHGVSLDA